MIFWKNLTTFNCLKTSCFRKKHKITREPEIGEVFLIGDDFKSYTALAKVIKIIQDRDEKVRT